jgi:endonuclease V-like protein UPF0215 family
MKASEEKISIGKVIRDGQAFDPKNWGKRQIDPQNMPTAVQALFNLLEARQVDYVLVGGIALLAYLQGRNTSDIDLIMAASSLKKIPEIEIETKEVYFGRGTYEGLQVLKGCFY